MFGILRVRLILRFLSLVKLVSIDFFKMRLSQLFPSSL